MIANFAETAGPLVPSGGVLSQSVPYAGVKYMNRAQMNSLLHDIDREIAERMVEVAMDQIMPIGVDGTAKLLPLTATTTKGTVQIGGVNAFCVMQGATTRTERRVLRFPVANASDGDLAAETHIGGIVISNTNFNSLTGTLEAGATLNPAIDERIYWTTSNGAHAIYRSMTQGSTVITTTGARYADYAYSNGRYYRQSWTTGVGITIQSGTGTQLQDVSWSTLESLTSVFCVDPSYGPLNQCCVTALWYPSESEVQMRKYRGGPGTGSGSNHPGGFVGSIDTYTRPRAIWTFNHRAYVILTGESNPAAWCIVRSNVSLGEFTWQPTWEMVFETEDHTTAMADGFRAFPSQGQFCQIVHVGLGRIAWSVDGLRWHLRSVPGGGYCKIVGNQLYTPLGVSGFL